MENQAITVTLTLDYDSAQVAADAIQSTAITALRFAPQILTKDDCLAAIAAIDFARDLRATAGNCLVEIKGGAF
jgi:NADH/NAD ratio-sensing transcriptional regulator Rex